MHGKKHNKRRTTRSAPAQDAAVSRAFEVASGAAGRAARRPADGDPRHHGREHRAAEPRQGPAAQRLDRSAGRSRATRSSSAACSSSAAALADLLGRRRLFLTGLGVFTVSSLASALAGTAGALFAARAGQGLGAAMLSPAALSIITTSFQGNAAGEGARGLGRGRRRRRSDRRPRRRPADRVRRLADDLLRQPPRRDRRSRSPRSRSSRATPRSRAGADSTCPARSSAPPAWARSSTRSRRPISAGWGSTQTLGLALAGARRASPRSPPGSAGPRSRCSGSSGSPTAPSAAASS